MAFNHFLLENSRSQPFGQLLNLHIVMPVTAASQLPFALLEYIFLKVFVAPSPIHSKKPTLI